jgi:hypothetical protein
MHYKVPLPNYPNFENLQLFMAIIDWEVGIVVEGSQNVWATCLTQCQVPYKKFPFKTLHPNASRKIFKT